MTIAVDLGRKATKQTNKPTIDIQTLVHFIFTFQFVIKAVEKKSPDFVFYAPKIRINKLVCIFLLCYVLCFWGAGGSGIVTNGWCIKCTIGRTRRCRFMQ